MTKCFSFTKEEMAIIELMLRGRDYDLTEEQEAILAQLFNAMFGYPI